MLRKDQFLQNNILASQKHVTAPVREGFGQGLVEAGDNDQRIVGLCADLTESTRMILFAEKYPERFIQIGVAEQNLASVASGMARMGKIPWMSSYAMFSPGRNWEQIRTTICYNDVPVKIAGSHAGISVGPDGGTHQAIEDIALMRIIPNIDVVVPCDVYEARKATLALSQTEKPAYLRLARNATTVITTEESPFEIGKANVLYESKKPDVGIIACGPLVYNALCAAEELRQMNIEVTVVNCHTIKPLDKKTIIDLAQKAHAIVTVEEHQIAGGLGGAIAELLAQHEPVPIEFIGVHDMFGQSGTPEELVAHYEMDVHDIVTASKKVLARKNTKSLLRP